MVRDLKTEINWIQKDSPIEGIRERMLIARKISWENFGKKIRFYVPSFLYYRSKHFQVQPRIFPSISVTGSGCALNCEHCSGKILGTMIPARTPEELIQVCSWIKLKGGLGCLISGGCLPNGTVPLVRFVDAIAEIKRKLGLKIITHTGLVDLETAERLKEAGVDAALIDIIGSDETIREIYHLKASVKDYERSLKALKKSQIPFVPHVLVGLHYGKIEGEMNALKMISKYSPSALIFIVFFPIIGTPMEHVKPPKPEVVIEMLIQARLMMPDVPLALGCARPKGKHRVKMDSLAVEAGVNGIAFPAEEAIKQAETLGLDISFSPLCCSQIYEDIKNYRANE